MITSRPPHLSAASIYSAYGPRRAWLPSLATALHPATPAPVAEWIVSEAAALSAAAQFDAAPGQYMADLYAAYAIAGPGVLCVALSCLRPTCQARRDHIRTAREFAVAILREVRSTTDEARAAGLSRHLFSIAVAASRAQSRPFTFWN